MNKYLFKVKNKDTKASILTFCSTFIIDMNRYLYAAYSAQMSNSVTYIHLESV